MIKYLNTHVTTKTLVTNNEIDFDLIDLVMNML